MADFDMQEYVKSLGGKTDGELCHLVDQIRRNGKTEISGDLLAAVNEEIADRTRHGVRVGE